MYSRDTGRGNSREGGGGDRRGVHGACGPRATAQRERPADGVSEWLKVRESASEWLKGRERE